MGSDCEVAQNVIRGLAFYVEGADFSGVMTSRNYYDVLTAKETLYDEYR